LELSQQYYCLINGERCGAAYFKRLDKAIKIDEKEAEKLYPEAFDWISEYCERIEEE
jgi:hypothetical protein